jgi:sialate O-acetylesterase
MNFPSFKFQVVFLLFAALCAGPAWAAVKLASPFTDCMVLQRELPVPVWGTAEAGTKIMVKFAGQTKSAIATVAGDWRVELDPLKTSTEAQNLTVIEGSATSVELRDVLVGEVWLCSGQSNMDFTVAKTPKYYFAGVTNEAEEVAAASYPRIRMFTGEWAKSYEPKREVGGTWKICTPENVKEFSAVGYFFARRLQRDLDVPVGIVTLTFGASTPQAWIRREVIAADPRLKPSLEKFDADVAAFRASPDALKQYAQKQAEWDGAAEEARAKGQKAPRRPRDPDPVQDQHNPTVMFNGMIAPVVPFAIRGVLWYQGESITAPRELFPVWNEALIKDWRKLWERELPFYFCQLAAQDAASNSPEVREMQAQALALTATAMVVTVDIGEKKNVHPRNKQDVGDRLARIALAKQYGQPIEWSGPVYEAMKIEGTAIRLKFAHAAGLTARDGALRTFEVAGVDGKFVPAQATIDGESVLVNSADVATPTVVRYAWSAYPEGCNLYNTAGLPAVPFRTDAAK